MNSQEERKMKDSFGLNAEVKKAYCEKLTSVLVELRKRLGQTQEETEATSGISRVTLSQIESGRSRMSWLHFTALMHLFVQNQDTKELLYVRGVLDARLLRLFQRLSPEDAPEFNPEVSELHLLKRRSGGEANA